MQKLAREYEQCRAALKGRIQSLDAELKRDGLGNQERDILLLRRNLLMAERLEMLQVLHTMRQYNAEGGNVQCQN